VVAQETGAVELAAHASSFQFEGFEVAETAPGDRHSLVVVRQSKITLAAA